MHHRRHDPVSTSCVFAGLALAALLTPACGGKSPPTTVWSLRPDVPADAMRSGDGPKLGVTRFDSSIELRTTRLTWREGDGRQLQHYNYHEWTDYPDNMLRELALAELAATEGLGAVADAPPKAGLDAILSARLVEFDEWDKPSGIETRVTLRWRLETQSGDLIDGGLARGTARATRKSVEAVVAAMDEAARHCVKNLATAVDEALN